MHSFEVELRFHDAIDVAHDHEPSEIRERALTRREDGAADEVHRDVYARPAGRLARSIAEVASTRMNRDVETERRELFELALRARNTDHSRAHMLRELNGSDAHARRSARDQQPFAGFEPPVL